MPRGKQKRGKRRRAFSARVVRDGIECRWCGAARGEACWDRAGVQLRGCHWHRHNDYERQAGIRPPRGAEGMTTYFVCPICGLDHARAACPEADSAD